MPAQAGIHPVDVNRRTDGSPPTGLSEKRWSRFTLEGEAPAEPIRGSIHGARRLTGRFALQLGGVSGLDFRIRDTVRGETDTPAGGNPSVSPVYIDRMDPRLRGDAGMTRWERFFEFMCKAGTAHHSTATRQTPIDQEHVNDGRIRP